MLPGQCFQPNAPAAGVCWAPIALENDYQLATNNYIAQGGSGFRVLQRNTTQLNTNILQRDSLIDYMRQGNPCGYNKTAYADTQGLQPCSADTDCTTDGYVCACPNHATLTTPGGTTTCTMSVDSSGNR